MKILDKLRRHPGVREVYHDSDGWWMELKDGFRNSYDEPLGYLHGAHEDTLTALARRLKGIEPCDCPECVPPTPKEAR